MSDDLKDELATVGILILAVLLVVALGYLTGSDAAAEKAGKEQARRYERQLNQDEEMFQKVFAAPARLKGEDSTDFSIRPDPQEVAIRSARVQEALNIELRNILSARENLQKLQSDHAGEDYQTQVGRAKEAKEGQDELVAAFVKHVAFAAQFAGEGLYREILSEGRYINWCFVADRFKNHNSEGLAFFEYLPDGWSCYDH